jgi:pimeloyl-ACP methyl ester carboxylesterase
MVGSVAAWCAALVVGTGPVETRFVQVAPTPLAAGAMARTAGQPRAVVLIHGLRLNFLHPRDAARAVPRYWQEPGSKLVQALARDADVFAFCYGQTAAVQEIAALPDLGAATRRLRQLGYTEVVLIGCSAGGLIARQLVEDDPAAGVTRVIQVCAPNIGTSLANLKTAGGVGQGVFVQSLTKPARLALLARRQGKAIPEGVQLACVVGTGLLFGDGVVSVRSQWPDDLQRQGIPAYPLPIDHKGAVRGERGVQLIARLAREEQPRWSAPQVAATRKRLWE